VIVLAVRWYLPFRLSHRDVEELLAERGVEVDHVTVYRWVLRFTPLLVDAARPCRHRVGDRWSVDETYVKAGGRCLRHSADSPRPSGSLRQPAVACEYATQMVLAPLLGRARRLLDLPRTHHRQGRLGHLARRGAARAGLA
jgi:hypothetical protein